MSEPELSAPSVDKQRALIVFTATLAAIAIVFASAVAIANTTLYSATAFVTQYLEALSSGDIATATEMSGLDLSSSSDKTQILASAAMKPITDVTVLSDTGNAHERSVSVSYTIDATSYTSHFDLVHDGTVAGLFTRWRFASPMVARLSVRVTDADTFTVNDLTVPATSFVSDYAVLTPMVYSVRHESTLLTSDTELASYTDTNTPVSVHLTARANDLFTSTVQRQVDEYLSSCTAQHVLWPAGCPFGTSIKNRLDGTPTWAITEAPVVQLRKVSDGRWTIDNTEGQATITGTERLLSDGSTRPLKRTIDFSLSYVVTVTDDYTITLSHS